MIPDVDFTKVRSMNFPRSVILGHGVISQVKDVCDNLLFGKNGVIITGQQTYEAAGKLVYDQVSEGYNITNIFIGNSDQDNIDKAVATAREADADFALAVGGGSKIDIAKMVSKELGIPFVSIPTSIAHDGICSDRASIKTREGAPMTIQGFTRWAQS